MKRTILYLGILAALFAAPVEQMEVGKLIPVQAVAVYKETDKFVIETDTENKGIGNTVEEALQNLKETACGTIYLDTAQYLLITEDAQDAAEILRNNLKPSTQMSTMERSVPMKEVAKFLDAHGKLPKLEHWKKGVELPVLSMSEDSYFFSKKDENNA